MKLRPVAHFDADAVKCSGLAAFRLEAENVLAVHFFADELNGMLQGALLQKGQLAAAGGVGEEVGEIRFAQTEQFLDSV